MRIGLVSLYVNDPIQAFEFYTRVLGFQEKLFMPEANLAIIVSPLEPQGTAILLEPNENEAARRYQETLYNLGLPVIVFNVENVEASFENLSSKNVKFRKEPTRTDWGTEAVFDDGCGNYIQIYQP